MQRAFGEPHIEFNAVEREYPLHIGKFFAEGVIGKDADAFFLLFFSQTFAIFRDVVADGFEDIVTVVAVFGEFHGLAEEFTETGVEREAQHTDLISGVVDVVFLFHIVTGERKQVGEGVADGAAPSVAHMEQAGGIGADEFNLNPGTFADSDGTVAVAHLMNETRHGEKPVFLQKEVDKAGAGDLGAFNKGALGIEM